MSFYMKDPRWYSLKSLLGRQPSIGTRDPAGQSTHLCDFRFSLLNTVAVLRAILGFPCVRQRGLMWAAPFAFESRRPSEGLHQAEAALMAKGIWSRVASGARESTRKPNQTKQNGSSGLQLHLSLCCVLSTSLWRIKVLKHCSNRRAPILCYIQWRYVMTSFD